jgi:hypothetical protein
VACPFFMPTSKWEDGGWLHPARLPLGGGWTGHCSVPGHEGAKPEPDEVREFCNLGYASNCPRLPKERTADAVRFGVAHDRGSSLQLRYVFECGHRPAGHGMLEHDLALGRWTTTHPQMQIQKMAECFLQSYLLRKSRPATASLNASESHDTE